MSALLNKEVNTPIGPGVVKRQEGKVGILATRFGVQLFNKPSGAILYFFRDEITVRSLKG